jgi:hypothetical protein
MLGFAKGICMWKRSFALVLCMACLASCESQPTDKQAEFNDVVMPNGTVIKNVPKGITKAQLLKKLERSGYNINELLTAEEERVVYQIRGLDGPTYTISGPSGKTRDEFWAKILARVPQAGIPITSGTSRGDALSYEAFETERRGPYEGEITLNYGSSRYGDPLYRYRGEIDSFGYVRLRNLDGDTLRGYVYDDGSIRLTNFDGDVYRGRIDDDGSIRLKDYNGSTLSGQLDRDF